LLTPADIVLEDWGLGVSGKRVLDYSELRETNLRLIYGAITGFGDRGPLAGRPASELVIQAMTEYCGGLGEVGGAPVRMGADVASISTAIYAFDAILAAVFQRLRTGQGQHVSVSQFGTLLYARGTVWASQGDPDDWDGWAARPFMPPDYGYQAKDGKIYFLVLRGDQEEFDSLMLALGLEEHLADPRFDKGGRDAIGIGRYAAEVKPIWEDAFRNYTTAELTDLVQQHGGLVAPLHDYHSLLLDPRVQPLRILADAQVDGRTYRTLSSPWKFSGAASPPSGSTPRLDQHTAEVFSWLGTGVAASP
jgi:crotonobetainyl-CoA:carnitine CoA-transferase CaiB-like acyl-CoA transferase